MGEILFKIHKSYRLVVAICDKDVYGRKLVSPRDDSSKDDSGEPSGEPDGRRQLDLTGPFFKGEEISEGDLKEKIIGIKHLGFLK